MLIFKAQNKLPKQPSNEWGKVFVDNKVSVLDFLFVTSFLKGNFMEHLQSLAKRRNVAGAAIGVENLLYLAEAVRRGSLSEDDLPDMLRNGELRIAL